MTSTTIKGRVAQRLVEEPKTWIDSAVFSNIGQSGDRRLRELRQEGWSIKTRRNPDEPRTFQHMLTRVPAKKTLAAVI